MYESDYEKYMKSVLGYSSIGNANTYYDGRTYFPYSEDITLENDMVDSKKIESLYPEIYRLLKPMVTKACNNNRSNEITKDLLEQMAMDIYSSIEPDKIPQYIENIDNRQNGKTVQNNVDDQRGCKNCNLLMKDLIKILLLNQIISSRPPKPPRPPIGPYPPKPGPGPYPPRPPYFF